MKQGWEIKKLGEVAHISPSKSEVKTFALNPMDMVSFLPMEDLTIGRTFVHPNKQKILSEVEGSYTYFKEGDVLLAKVTPCFENGKLAIAKGLCNNIGFGSSEYIVIRPMQHIVNSQYLIYLLQTNAFRNGGRTLMIGACGLKRLPKPYVANYELPVPSLAEQKRIVEILDREFERIDALKANAEQNLQHAKDLFQAALRQELQCDKYHALNEVYNIKTGKLNSNAAEEGGIFPFFTCSREIFAINTYAFDCEAILLAGNNASGDFNVKYYNGKFNAYQRTYVITAKNEKTNVRILYYILTHYLADLKQMSLGANTKFLKLGMIEDIRIPDFNEHQMRNVVARLDNLNERCKTLEENYRKTIALCDNMKQALLRKAFNGEL